MLFMVRTSLSHYADFIGQFLPNMDPAANRSGKIFWKDRCTGLAVAVRFNNKRGGEAVYYIRPEFYREVGV